MKMTAEAGKHTNTPTLVDTGPRTKKLVLFDFDGTITTKDTLFELARFYRGTPRYITGLLLLVPILSLYALKIIPNWKAKQWFLTRFFKGENIEDFNAKCYIFATKHLPALIRPAAKEAIRTYQSENAVIAVVSASAENWVKPWCEQQGILCLASRLEVKQGILTGNLDGRNCYGDEKVCRIKDAFNLSDFNHVVAYGDSTGDQEMLALAGERYYKPFRTIAQKA